MRLLPIITSCLFLLAACGLKGPLYLPPPDPDAGQAAAEQARTQQRDPDKDSENSLPPAIN